MKWRMDANSRLSWGREPKMTPVADCHAIIWCIRYNRPTYLRAGIARQQCRDKKKGATRFMCSIFLAPFLVILVAPKTKKRTTIVGDSLGPQHPLLSENSTCGFRHHPKGLKTWIHWLSVQRWKWWVSQPYSHQMPSVSGGFNPSKK